MIYKGNDKPMAPGVAISLKRLAWRHRKKLCITFMLVIAENVAFLLYPVLAGMAINAILGGQTSHAALYGLMVLFMWCMGAARRSVGLQQALMTHHNFLRNFPSSGISVNGFRLTMRPLYQENHAELLPFVC